MFGLSIAYAWEVIRVWYYWSLDYPSQRDLCTDPQGKKRKQKKVQQIDYHGIILIADGVGDGICSVWLLGVGRGEEGGVRLSFSFAVWVSVKDKMFWVQSACDFILLWQDSFNSSCSRLGHKPWKTLPSFTNSMFAQVWGNIIYLVMFLTSELRFTNT